MKIICNNKVIDLDKFDTVTCRESLVVEGFQLRQLEEKQVARIGNSVVPIMAQKLVEANRGYLKVGERIPKLYINDDSPQLSFM